MRSANNQERVHQDLLVLLADTYLVYIKAQKFHWNVEDRQFFSLHGFFEKLYESLSDAVDDIAERLRVLNYPAPGSFKEFSNLATLEEALKPSYSADEMVQLLALDYQKIIDFLNNAARNAGDADDLSTQDFFIERLRAHEKELWMIRSHLKRA